MADQRSSGSNPLSSWREFMNQSETKLNTLFNELMATDGYSSLMGSLTKVIVSMQKSTTERMERYFTTLSLPTRTDVIDLGKRLSAIERRLIAIEENLAKLTGSDLSDGKPSHALSRPARTRKPASGQGGTP